MKKTFKLSIFLILILTMAVAVLGCTKKTPDKTTTPGKQTEQNNPDKVETPEEKRDKEAESLFDLTLRNDGNYEVKSYKGSQKEVTIPNEYKGKKVVGIESNAFENSSIESITIPSTVEKIGDHAFYKCYALQTVTLNEGLKEIGWFTFAETAISEIKIPSTVEGIVSDTFSGCKNLKSVTLNEGLKSIGRGAFNGTSIESIEMTSTVEKIERFAFYDCKNLKTVTLNEGLKEIDSGAFRDCDKLGRIECNVRKDYVEANRSKFEGLIQKKSIINWLNG